MICPHCKEEIDGVYITHMSRSYAMIDKNNIIIDVLDDDPIYGIEKATCSECGGEITSMVEDPHAFFD